MQNHWSSLIFACIDGMSMMHMTAVPRNMSRVYISRLLVLLRHDGRHAHSDTAAEPQQHAA